MRKYQTNNRLESLRNNLVQDFYNAFELDYSEQARYIDGYKTVPTDVFVELICLASALEKVSFAFERGRYDLDQVVLPILIKYSDDDNLKGCVKRVFERWGK